MLRDMERRNMESDARRVDVTATKNWLLADGTITLPRWVFAVAALVVLVVALD